MTWFPVTYAIGLFVLMVVGFSYNFSPETRNPTLFRTPYLVHALACAGWLGLLIAQTSLARVRNVRLHMRLGQLGALVAAAVVASSLAVVAVVAAEDGGLGWQTWGNAVSVVTFGVFIALGFRARHDHMAHRRFMLVGTIFIMSVVYSRLGGAFGPAAFLLSQPAIWGALLLYDRVATGRLHRVTLIGVALQFTHLVYYVANFASE